MKLGLLILFGILFVIGDTVSTYYALAHGAIEMNPFMRVILPYWPIVVLVKFMLTLAFGYVVLKTSETIGISVLSVLNVAMLLVVIQNFTFCVTKTG